MAESGDEVERGGAAPCRVKADLAFSPAMAGFGKRGAGHQ